MTARIEKFSVVDLTPGGYEVQIKARIIKTNEMIPQIISEKCDSLEPLKQRHKFNWPLDGRNTPEGNLIKVKLDGGNYCLEE